MVPSWAQGRDAAYDITDINPLQETTVAQAAQYDIPRECHALNVAWDRKM